MWTPAIRGIPPTSSHVDAAPLLGQRRLAGEAAGKLLVAGASTLTENAPRLADGAERPRAAVEAGEHQRRVERQRGDGVRGRPGGPVLARAAITVTAVGIAAIAARNSSVVGVGIAERHRARAGKYDAAAVRRPSLDKAALPAALALGACGTEGITVADDDPDYPGAVLFAERCSGCHTLDRRRELRARPTGR